MIHSLIQAIKRALQRRVVSHERADIPIVAGRDPPVVNASLTTSRLVAQSVFGVCMLQ